MEHIWPAENTLRASEVVIQVSRIESLFCSHFYCTILTQKLVCMIGTYVITTCVMSINIIIDIY